MDLEQVACRCSVRGTFFGWDGVVHVDVRD